MKKTILTLLILPILILSACAGQTPATSNADVAQQPVPAVESVAQGPAASVSTVVQEAAAGSAELSTSYENAASIELQLLIGTLKLIGTDQAVTKDQATALTPLWTNLQTLQQSMRPDPTQNNSDSQTQTDTTAIQSQVDEAVKQIQSLMTSEQLQAIAGMQITQESAMTFMQELGMTMGGPGQGTGNGNMPQSPDGTPPAGGPGGDGPGGAGAPPGGGQPPSGGQPGGDPIATPPTGQNRTRGGMIPPQLIDTLVQVLQKIAAGETVITIPTISANTPVAPSQ